jgi:hypothetical protein
MVLVLDLCRFPVRGMYVNSFPCRARTHSIVCMIEEQPGVGREGNKPVRGYGNVVIY